MPQEWSARSCDEADDGDDDGDGATIRTTAVMPSTRLYIHYSHTFEGGLFAPDRVSCALQARGLFVLSFTLFLAFPLPFLPSLGWFSTKRYGKNSGCGKKGFGAFSITYVTEHADSGYNDHHYLYAIVLCRLKVRAGMSFGK